jgi:rhodanese-related sulfurtransferase
MAQLGRREIMAVPKIDVRQARNDVEVSDALLVCAYDNQEKFDKNHLAGAIPLDDLRAQEVSLSKQRELIFYCA